MVKLINYTYKNLNIKASKASLKFLMSF